MTKEDLKAVITLTQTLKEKVEQKNIELCDSLDKIRIKQQITV